MYGYKGFDKDFCCLGFQYEVGKTYELEGELEICKNGFHFCTDPNDVTVYYPITCWWLVKDPICYHVTMYKVTTENRYALVEALGETVGEGGYNRKRATNKIKIVRERYPGAIIWHYVEHLKPKKRG